MTYCKTLGGVLTDFEKSGNILDPSKWKLGSSVSTSSHCISADGYPPTKGGYSVSCMKALPFICELIIA